MKNAFKISFTQCVGKEMHIATDLHPQEITSGLTVGRLERDGDKIVDFKTREVVGKIFHIESTIDQYEKDFEYAGEILMIDLDEKGRIVGKAKATLDENSAKYYRGVTKEEAKRWLKGKPLPTTDLNLMPLDGEVIKYGIGDSFHDMDEDEIEAWIKDVCPWYDGSIKSIKGGLNVTTDFINAQGYGDFVLGLDSCGDDCDFSDAHTFFRKAKDAILIFVYDVEKNIFYPPTKKSI